ncbi:MAG TPA: 50S ribosomal protein L35ae [Candidatus Nanoarchaeia archaeon]|nr:50S ribosomal protein L35ae [Candidatus Nanoarchaeia archaeon]
MEAVIINYRSNRHSQTCHHIIAETRGISKRDDAAKLVGKEVSWKSPAGKEIKGKVASAHGNKGALRIIFERGLPGQALGGKIEIKA